MWRKNKDVCGPENTNSAVRYGARTIVLFSAEGLMQNRQHHEERIKRQEMPGWYGCKWVFQIYTTTLSIR